MISLFLFNTHTQRHQRQGRHTRRKIIMTKKSITHFHTIFSILLFSLSSVAMNMNNQTILYAVNYTDDRTGDLHYYYYYIITRQQSVKESGTTRWFKKWMDATHAWFLIEFLFLLSSSFSSTEEKTGKVTIKNIISIYLILAYFTHSIPRPLSNFYHSF